jgi:hypothetical protein
VDQLLREPGKFPLVLDPVVAGSQLTRVLIDGGSGLNLLFVSTLKKMGLDISNMLVPSKSSFYGIIPGYSATPVGSITLPVTFGTKGQLPHGVRQVRGGELRVIIPRHPRHTYYGQVHGCTPLCLPATQDARQDRGADLPRQFEEVIRLRPSGNLKKSYDCDQEAIEYASSTHVPDASAEVFTAMQQLHQS